MIQLILLSLLADPSGLQAALLEADGVEVSYARTNATIDIKGDEVKRLAKLIKVNDDVVLLEYTGGVPSTNDVFVIRPYKGKKVTEYTELGGRILVFGHRSVTFANTEFHLALRDYFEARKLPPTLKPEVVREIKGVTVAVQAVSDDGMYLLTAGDGLSVFNLNAKGAGTSLGKTIKHERLAHAKALASKGNFIFVAGGVVSWFSGKWSVGRLALAS